jgi:uncharacterized protein
MPHERPRVILHTLLKRLKLWPVVGIVGVRQSGKSVLLRKLLLPKIAGRYTTMDSLTLRSRAEASPEGFTELDQKQLQIIDEVQKVPNLFDSIKLHVDENRRPGMYVISGSTEFSKFTGIRESLTGRIGILRLYPLNLNELYYKNELGFYWTCPITRAKEVQASISLENFELKLNRGGMPGFCFIRNDLEFAASCDMWVETTCYRDLQQVQLGKLEGSLGQALLSEIARQTEPTAATLAKALRKDARVISRYLQAFEAILVIHRLEPHPTGVGKPIYTLCDVGIASHLGASRENLIKTHLLLEALTLFEAQGFGRPKVYYYRNEKTSRIPLVFDWQEKKSAPVSIAVQFQDSESLATRDFSSLHAFSKRAQWKGRLLMFSQTTRSYLEGSVEVVPLRG